MMTIDIMKYDDKTLPDIKPQSVIASLDRSKHARNSMTFDLKAASRIIGMSPSFIKKVCGAKKELTVSDVIKLLDQDSFSETFVPRSKILDYLIAKKESKDVSSRLVASENLTLVKGDALNLLPTVQSNSVQCVVTSTPYWGMRLYKESQNTSWADGMDCPFGHEQTPESFVRHSIEVLDGLFDLLTDDGSIWWNVMDTYNTRTQIRRNSSEALNAMKGKDSTKWNDHECRRYSAGHGYLKDGEQCLIPSMIAQRASQMGYYVKSVITWAKTATTPEPQKSRVSRNLEYIIHLTKQRTPYFEKEAYRSIPVSLGGRNVKWESDKLSDVWTLPTSSGRDGHGAQFPLALPGRCIALSSKEGQTVLDPFVGAGNAGVAARLMGRKFIGFDINQTYLNTAKRKIDSSELKLFENGVRVTM